MVHHTDDDFYEDDTEEKPKKKVAKKKIEDLDEEEEKEVKEEKPTKKKKLPKTNVDAVRRIMAGMLSGEKWWKPQPGKNQIRILPSNTEDGLPCYPSILHHGFKDESGRRAYPCLSVFSQPCPVCKVINHFDSDPDSDIQAIKKGLLPRRTYLFNIIDRAAGNNVVKVYSAPPSVANIVIGAFSEEDYGDISDPEEGFDVVIHRDGQGLNTKYKVTLRRNPSPIGVDGWEDNLFDLKKEAYREIPTYKEYCNIIEECYGDTLVNLEKILAPKKIKPLTELDEEEEL